MASLYELTGAYKHLEVSMLCNPDDEELQAEFDKISDDLEIKAENYGKIIKNLEADEKALAEEEARLAKRRNGIRRNIESMKANLFASMKETGKTKFKTELFSFGIQKNGGLKPLIMNVDVSELPKELQKVTVEPDNMAIRNYIAETGDISYAELGEASESLRIR